jgi:hypothetical protein
MDRVQQFVGKVAANHGSYLCHLLGRPQPIQPRHQRIMQGHRNLELGEFRIATLEHYSCQFFHKKGHPAGALEYGRDSFLRQSLFRRYFSHHRAHVARTQPVKGDLGMMRPRRPLSVKLGARREQQQQPRRRPLLYQKLE